MKDALELALDLAKAEGKFFAPYAPDWEHQNGAGGEFAKQVGLVCITFKLGAGCNALYICKRDPAKLNQTADDPGSLMLYKDLWGSDPRWNKILELLGRQLRSVWWQDRINKLSALM